MWNPIEHCGTPAQKCYHKPAYTKTCKIFSQKVWVIIITMSPQSQYKHYHWISDQTCILKNNFPAPVDFGTVRACTTRVLAAVKSIPSSKQSYKITGQAKLADPTGDFQILFEFYWVIMGDQGMPVFQKFVFKQDG